MRQKATYEKAKAVGALSLSQQKRIASQQGTDEDFERWFRYVKLHARDQGWSASKVAEMDNKKDDFRGMFDEGFKCAEAYRRYVMDNQEN